MIDQASPVQPVLASVNPPPDVGSGIRRNVICPGLESPSLLHRTVVQATNMKQDRAEGSAAFIALSSLVSLVHQGE